VSALFVEQVRCKRQLFEEILQDSNFRGVCWWFIDYLNDPDFFYCNDEMVSAFNLTSTPQNKYSIAQFCPIAGDYNRHVAEENQQAADEIFREYQEMLEGQTDVYENEFPYLSPLGGKQFFKSQAKVVLRDKRGQPLLAHGVILEITHEKLLAESLENERLKFQVLSERDTLTGLVNRRKMYESLSLFSEQAVSEKTEILLMMFDIDYFKQVNDTQGHAYGDEVLRRVSDVIRDSFGKGVDSEICRWGGEEFLVVLKGVTVETCQSLYQNIQQSLRHQIWKPSVNPMVDWVTVSAGAICISPEQLDKCTLDEWIVKADERLYIAKHRGRNQLSIEHD